MDTVKPLLDVRAAADTAGVSTQYIRMLLAGNILEDGGVEGALTVTRESLEAWLRIRPAKKERLKAEGRPSAMSEVYVPKPNRKSNCGYGHVNGARLLICWALGYNTCPLRAFGRGCVIGKVCRALYARQQADRKRESEA